MTLVEAGFDLAYGMRGKGDAHEGSDCLGLGVWWLALSWGLVTGLLGSWLGLFHGCRGLELLGVRSWFWGIPGWDCSRSSLCVFCYLGCFSPFLCVWCEAVTNTIKLLWADPSAFDGCEEFVH